MKNRLNPLFACFLLSLAACGDDPQPEPEPTDTTVPCQSSEECSDEGEGQVCRVGICVEAPECESITDCEETENCIEGFCAFDPEVCTSDGDCEGDEEICVDGGCRAGCRSQQDCEEIELCTPELVCERRPCTEVPCDDGYDCIEDTGECLLRPCNGGCEEPLQCRESDDRCVVCMGDDECGISQSCNEDGDCVEDACEVHEDCEEGTFCINELCQVAPDCTTDDAFEENDTYDDGDLLTEGDYTGIVSCPYDDDYFKVVADGEHSLTIDVLFDHEQGDVDLEVFNTVGVLFARRISESDNETIAVNVGKTGVYTVRVWQEAGTQGVDYELRMHTGAPVEVEPDLCVDDTFEPNDTRGNATEIFTGRWTGMSICDGDEDYYQIPASPGEMIQVCVAPSELYDIALGLEVIASGEGVILLGAGRTEFCVDEDLTVGESFYAHVFASTDGDESPYHITFDVDPGCSLFDDEWDQAGKNDRIPRDDEDPLDALDSEDLPAELRVCPGDSDFWPVPLMLRDTLTASIDFVHDDGDLQLKLYRPNGTVRLGSSGRTDQESFNYQAESTGTYYLRVYGEGTDMGVYTLDYTVDPYCEVDAKEPNDMVDQAVAVSEGDTADLWRCAGDDDYFKFAIPTGTVAQELTFTLSFELDDGELSLQVRKPGSAEWYAADTVAEGAWLPFTEPADLIVGDAEFYVIHVSAPEGIENTYSLNVDLVEEGE